MPSNKPLIETYLSIRQNRWYWLFALFCRVSLAFAFIAAGLVKIVGERFANGLSELHPMGSYLTALHDTGYYYTFIGYLQVLAAVLLIIPRTVVLGALIYFPIILNICILSSAVRFEGSIVTAPLMVMANLFLLVWNYDKLQYVLPLKRNQLIPLIERPKQYSKGFPWLFAGFVGLMVALTLFIAEFGFDIMPRNSLKDCKAQFTNQGIQTKGYEFCECIHVQGNSLNECLNLMTIN